MDAYDVVVQLAKDVARELNERLGPPGDTGWFLYTVEETRWDDPDPPVPNHPREWHTTKKRLMLSADGSLHIHTEWVQQDFNKLTEGSRVSAPLKAEGLLAVEP